MKLTKYGKQKKMEIIERFKIIIYQVEQIKEECSSDDSYENIKLDGFQRNIQFQINELKRALY